MSTLSKTRNSFERLVRQKGASVKWHREIGGDLCPCLTPEGFRDPEWHRLNPPGIVQFQRYPDPLGSFLSTIIPSIAASYTDPQYQVQVVAFQNGSFTLWEGYPAPSATRDGSWTDLVAALGPLLNVNPALGLPETDLGYIGFYPVPAGGKIFLWVTKPGIQNDPVTGAVVSTTAATGTWTDYSTGGVFTTVENLMPPRICNDDGRLVYDETIHNLDGTTTIIHHGTLQDLTVKGFVQPAFISTRSRSNQLLMQAFGEIQADDHIGIFPMDYDGLPLDFADWSNSGTDWLDFNNMRFVAVAWNLLPAPDNADVNHHWEVALRRVNEDEPA